MIKKRAKLLKSRIKSLLRENRQNIAAAAAVAATALAPKIEEKIKTFTAAGTRRAAHARVARARAKQNQHPRGRHAGRRAPAAAEVRAHVLQPAQPQPQNKPAAQPLSRNLPVKRDNIYKPRHHYKQSLAQKLVSAITSLISGAVRNFILWGLLSTAVFSAGAYFIFIFANAPKGLAPHYPLWYSIFLGFVIFGISALFGLLYGLTMAALQTLKTFSGDIGGLAKDAVNRVKNSIESRAENIGETLTHAHAAEIIKQIFADLTRNIRQYAAHTAAGAMAIALLTGAVFLAKNILTRSLEKIKNKADFFTLLSARAALILAVVLNLNLFAKAALCFGWLAGVLGAATQIIIILLLK
ncbi:MAG: hypothetical protein LBL61_07035 [Elusimicrobiota bacterium]|jgi:hypothetical protein|nr:hypothetical protein [Elusimicrobiota bacterium]